MKGLGACLSMLGSCFGIGESKIIDLIEMLFGVSNFVNETFNLRESSPTVLLRSVIGWLASIRYIRLAIHNFLFNLITIIYCALFLSKVSSRF